MEESVFYISEGDPNDKHSQESFAVSTSIHSSQLFASFRQCDAPQRGAALTGLGAGERLFTVSKNKALLLAYLWGKESPDQRIPVPEQLTCLALCQHPNVSTLSSRSCATPSSNLPSFRLPWLLAAGSKSGKVYIWELSSGNLLCVKEAHYQAISVIKFSSCGSFLITGGEDSRVAVWRTLDLISIYNKAEDNNRLASVRAYATFTDHSLAVTDLVVSETGILPDIRLYTVSRDSTLRIYDIMTKLLLTTFVVPGSIECIAKDPANRACYVGLSNGLIRTVPLYQVNPHTSVLESIGGCEKVITLDHDPNLNNTFVQHQQLINNKDATIAVTNLAMSMDGTTLVSGDSVGRVFVSDIATRQVVQNLKECNSPISYIQLNTCPVETVDSTTAGVKVDKHHRLIPHFKRVLASSDPLEHKLYMEIPSTVEEATDSFEDWLLKKSNQELQYKNNVEKVNSTVKVIGDSKDAERIKELEEKLSKVSQAYTDLRSKHEELYLEYAKMT